MAYAGGSYVGSGTGQVSTGDLYVDYSRPQSLNGWAYSENNPINFTDPTGHFICGFGSYWDDESKTCKPNGLGTPLSGLLPPWLATLAMQSSSTPGLGEIVATGIAGGVCVYAISALVQNAIDQNWTYAKKADIGFIERLLDKYGITDRAIRRRIHDSITGQGLTEAEIEAEIAEVARQLQQKKQSGGK